MKVKWGMYLFGGFQLFMALGAIWIGTNMISYPYGTEQFIQFPIEWIGRQPFKNWLAPGVIAICLFGLVNIIAAVYSFMRKKNKAAILSIIMGGILLVSILVEMQLLGVFLASVQLFILGSLQLVCGVHILKAWKIERNLSVE